ncbi:MAG: DUF4838 domain-containing protein [Thermoguttaceae bacterium]
MKRSVCCVLAFLVVCSAAWAHELTLVTEGKSDYVIVVPARPTAPQTTAARELQEHLAKVTGATLKIVAEDKVSPETPQIVVGPSDRMKQLLPTLDVNSLGYDGIVIKTVGKNLVLAGRPPRGTLYAVYTFLEDVVGCRWWTSTESFFPKKPTLAIAALDINYSPKLRYREAFYTDAKEGVFATRSKCNGYFDRVSPEYGGHYNFAGFVHYNFAGFVHTFYPLLPPKKYFAAHPEWYSEIGGKRTTERAQLCLTNEAMRKEFVRNALARLRKTPDAGFISISQNDWAGRCECAKCKAVEEEEGAPSGLLLRFVNAVAEDIGKEFPNVLVETLAYQYTRKPPKLARPRSNVVVRLCSIECSFVQPLEGPQNEKFCRDIVGWSKIAPKLFIWDYVANFSNYLIPHPNYRVLAPNIRFFVNHNTIGLFEQGDCGSSIGDFVRLRAWLIAHLMWNPNLDEKALIREFMQGYYGAAAPHLLAYLDVIGDAGERSGKHLRCYLEDTDGWLTLADLNKATVLFEKAQAAVADDPVISARVRRERLPLDHTWLTRYNSLKRSSKLQGTAFLGPKDPVAACEEFITLAEKLNVGRYREGKPFAERAESLRRRFGPAAPAPKLCSKLPENDWVDLQDNEFRLHKPGVCAKIVDDPKASDGKAARMPGDHRQWAVSFVISDDSATSGPWHCYVVARSEAKVKNGPALEIGIYDPKTRKKVGYRRLSVGESAGADYRVFDLGSHVLNDQMYFWVAPPKRPGEVDAVYIDRIFLIRDKQGSATKP